MSLPAPVRVPDDFHDFLVAAAGVAGALVSLFRELRLMGRDGPDRSA